MTRRIAKTNPSLPPHEPVSDDLAALRAAIEAEGQDELAAVNDEINALFAFRRAGLIHITPRHQLAALLKALEEERQALMVAARRRAQADMILKRRQARARLAPSRG